MTAFTEDSDGREVIPDRQLVAGENRSARHAELVVARLALPDAPGRVGVNRRAFALGAICRPAIAGKPDRHELLMRRIVRHALDRPQERVRALADKRKCCAMRLMCVSAYAMSIC